MSINKSSIQELCACTNGGKCVYGKICKKRGYKGGGFVWEKKIIIYVLGMYLCACVYTTQSKQTRCLVKTEQVPVPLKTINGQSRLELLLES